MKAEDTFTLTWCNKHKNWWVTNCPDCMVDANEESIKKAGIKEVVEWIKTKLYLRTDGFENELLQIAEAALLDDGVKRVWELQIEPKELRNKLKEWGID